MVFNLLFKPVRFQKSDRFGWLALLANERRCW